MFSSSKKKYTEFSSNINTLLWNFRHKNINPGAWSRRLGRAYAYHVSDLGGFPALCGLLEHHQVAVLEIIWAQLSVAFKDPGATRMTGVMTPTQGLSRCTSSLLSLYWTSCPVGLDGALALLSTFERVSDPNIDP